LLVRLHCLSWGKAGVFGLHLNAFLKEKHLMFKLTLLRLHKLPDSTAYYGKAGVFNLQIKFIFKEKRNSFTTENSTPTYHNLYIHSFLSFNHKHLLKFSKINV